MKTGIAVILLFPLWLFIAPWITMGYGEWHWPNPFSDQPDAWADVVVFYLPPILIIALITRKIFGKLNAPNQ